MTTRQTSLSVPGPAVPGPRGLAAAGRAAVLVADAEGAAGG
jgi:hypothetical protein